MFAATRPVIDFLNELDAETDCDEQPLTEAIRAAHSVPVTALMQERTKNESFSGKGSSAGIDPNRPVRISYQKPLRQVRAVRDKLGVETNKEAGSDTFDYYYEHELK